MKKLLLVTAILLTTTTSAFANWGLQSCYNICRSNQRSCYNYADTAREGLECGERATRCSNRCNMNYGWYNNYIDLEELEEKMNRQPAIEE